MRARDAVILLLACACSDPIDVRGVVRDGRTGTPIANARVGDEVSDAEGRFSLRAEGTLRVEAEGRCAATVEAAREVRVDLFDRLELGDDRVQVGFDVEVRVTPRLHCDEPSALRWRQVAGPTLGDRMRVDQGSLVVRTHALSDLVELDDRVGVVALDRRARGDYRFEARIGDAVRTLRIVAAPTSAGLYQVPTGADVHLNGGAGAGHGWLLLDSPPESRAALNGQGRLVSFRPDRFGTYLLEHAQSGTTMSIQAGAYEDVPRDCGRTGCHSVEAEGWTTTIHARTFRRGVEGELGDEFDERCWGCHATGVDPGVQNGGLHHSAARVGFEQPAPHEGLMEELPRRIRRHGSVWCSACHGPGRIVPPAFQWQTNAKFQVGVCARCHDVPADEPDANHVSPHVAEWRRAPMSRFTRELREDDPALREQCARCHSAQGYVEHARRGRTFAPDPGTVAPITCATCHDAHDASRPNALRVHGEVELPSGPATLGAGAICATCHRREDGGGDGAPHAPQADVLLGRGARLVPDVGVSSHGRAENACVTCHMARPDEGDGSFGRVGGHTFAVRSERGELSPAACASCHGGQAPLVREWVEGAGEQDLFEAFDVRLRNLRTAFARNLEPRNLRGACGRSARGVADHDGRVVLVDERGRLLGDCNDDGRFGEGEQPITSRVLPRRLIDIAHDLVLLERDGSRGAHHPRYMFRLGTVLLEALD